LSPGARGVCDLADAGTNAMHTAAINETFNEDLMFIECLQSARH
jgi:hypothetical protein